MKVKQSLSSQETWSTFHSFFFCYSHAPENNLNAAVPYNIWEKEKKCRAVLDLIHQELIGWLWFAIADVMWVTGCPALAPVKTSMKRRDIGMAASYFN